ncbi:hypothetical protein [Nesterenkonia ebinurensis]|uniref:hypothetical protein n=1 Tax=Nesterenkonia ebinurensis TaxID=2608252 RepID=UPI00123E027C|nr:hypothetical protein [Nesterenkonia ebinurensis]
MTPETAAEAQLIERFEPVMLGLLPGPDEPVHAETLLALCLAEGLVEILQWAKEGTGADPAASMWLAALRWHRIITGGFPAGAPEPPPRPTDHALKLILDSGGAEVIPGSADASLAGLADGEMKTPADWTRDGDRLGGENARAGARSSEAIEESHSRRSAHKTLIRTVPISLVPYVGTEMKQNWAAAAVCLTHGHPELVEKARRRATDFPAPAAPGARHELLTVVVADLARRWKETTA